MLELEVDSMVSKGLALQSHETCSSDSHEILYQTLQKSEERAFWNKFQTSKMMYLGKSLVVVLYFKYIYFKIDTIYV